MAESTNPYQAPESKPKLSPHSTLTVAKVDKLMFCAWPVVLGLNMLFPLLFISFFLGVESIRQPLVGGLLAAATLLGTGWWLCCSDRRAARWLIYGGLFVALLQVFPILHVLIAGMAANITTELGTRTGATNWIGEEVSAELGGFMITGLTGYAMTFVALVFGYLLSFMLPKEWSAR